MADNVQYTAGANSTPPNATVAATDELSDGSHAGLAKLLISADGDRTAIPATAADGLLVEVSNAGAITFGGLTDAELRATPVDVDVASALPAGTNNIGDVDIASALPAGNNNIGDVDVATVPAPLSTTGGGTEAAALRVTVANNSTGLLSVDDNGGSLTVDGPLTDTELRATPVPVSGTVTATGGLTDAELRATPVDVTVATALPAGTNNIGDVDVASSVLPTGASTLAEQQTQTTALQIMDDWDESDRAKVNPIVGQAGVAAGTGADGATVQRVSLATNVPLPAGTNNIGDVDIASFPAAALEVVGDVAADAAVPANPLAVGGRASDALPSEVSGDGDSVYQWLLRNGATMTADLPHLGLLGDPYTLASVSAQYTTTQTSTVLVNPGAGQRVAVTSIQIQAGGTTAGALQVYFGTGAFSRGTTPGIFDGEFAPSATLKPGFALAPPKPWIGAADDDLRVTDTAAINPLTITVWYYLI